MPAETETNRTQNSGVDDKIYREKRDRNNEAVRRNREKAKERAQQIQARVKYLTVRNAVLKERIKDLWNDVKKEQKAFHLLAEAKAKSRGIDVKNIDKNQFLQSDDEDEVAAAVQLAEKEGHFKLD